MTENMLKGTARLVNRRMKFECLVEGKPPVYEDYIPPYGDGEGHTALELLLLSLASCFGSSIRFLLGSRLKTEPEALAVEARGIRRTEHPLGFRSIQLELLLEAPGVDPRDLELCIALAEEKICPVYAMIRGNAEISVAYRLNGRISGQADGPTAGNTPEAEAVGAGKAAV